MRESYTTHMLLVTLQPEMLQTEQILIVVKSDAAQQYINVVQIYETYSQCMSLETKTICPIKLQETNKQKSVWLRKLKGKKGKTGNTECINLPKFQ